MATINVINLFPTKPLPSNTSTPMSEVQNTNCVL